MDGTQKMQAPFSASFGLVLFWLDADQRRIDITATHQCIVAAGV